MPLAGGRVGGCPAYFFWGCRADDARTPAADLPLSTGENCLSSFNHSVPPGRHHHTTPPPAPPPPPPDTIPSAPAAGPGWRYACRALPGRGPQERLAPSNVRTYLARKSRGGRVAGLGFRRCRRLRFCQATRASKVIRPKHYDFSKSGSTNGMPMCQKPPNPYVRMTYKVQPLKTPLVCPIRQMRRQRRRRRRRIDAGTD